MLTNPLGILRDLIQVLVNTVIGNWLSMSGNATSMIGLCQEGKSSPDALGRSAGVNDSGFFAAHLGLSPCGSFIEEEPDFHLLAQL
jgi:hypothetical protein